MNLSVEQTLDQQEAKLNKYLRYSLIAHVVIFLALTVENVFFSNNDISIQNAIRVDMVALPDKLAPNEMPAPAPEPVPPPETSNKLVEKNAENVKIEKSVVLNTKAKDPDSIRLNKSKAKQKQALEKLKQLEALESIQKEIDKDAKTNRNKNSKDKKYKGNVLSPGSSLTGITKLEADAYIDNVHQHMLSRWMLPPFLKNRNFRTDVIVKFDSNGNILSKEILKSSGNSTFDDYVLTAIQKSSPVPIPPNKFTRIASEQGFLFRFSHDND